MLVLLFSFFFSPAPPSARTSHCLPACPSSELNHITHITSYRLVVNSAASPAERRRLLLLTERRCPFGNLAYEKTTGFELIRGSPIRLFSDRDGGIIGECSKRCEDDARCKGFNMDYNRNECQALTKNSEKNLFNLRPSSGVTYFEAICLKGKAQRSCCCFDAHHEDCVY